MNLDAKDYELRVLQTWASEDETRTSMCVVYTYRTETGVTYMATNGHCILVRRSGSHREMSYAEIAKLTHDQKTAPPPWPRVLAFDPYPSAKPEYDNRSVSPIYFSWLAQLEKVAGKRLSEDYVPPSYETAKTTAKHRQNLKSRACSYIAIPSDPAAGWAFKIDTESALWTGTIMPRRT